MVPERSRGNGRLSKFAILVGRSGPPRGVSSWNLSAPTSEEGVQIRPTRPRLVPRKNAERKAPNPETHSETCRTRPKGPVAWSPSGLGATGAFRNLRFWSADQGVREGFPLGISEHHPLEGSDPPKTDQDWSRGKVQNARPRTPKRTQKRVERVQKVA